MRWWKLIFLFITCAGVLWYHNISSELTPEDERAIKSLGELQFIDSLKIQDIVNAYKIQCDILLDKNQGIPKGHAREPKDIIYLKAGAPKDWNRLFLKIVKKEGFDARQVTLVQGQRKWARIFSDRTPKYYGIEVFVNGDWAFYDAYSGWWAEDISGNLYPADEIMSTRPAWKFACPQDLYDMTKIGGGVIYGLYSGHGMDYPPYNFIPDYNLGELLMN